MLAVVILKYVQSTIKEHSIILYIVLGPAVVDLLLDLHLEMKIKPRLIMLVPWVLLIILGGNHQAKVEILLLLMATRFIAVGMITLEDLIQRK